MNASVAVAIRVPLALARQFKVAAKERGMTLSAYIRWAAAQYTKTFTDAK